MRTDQSVLLENNPWIARVAATSLSSACVWRAVADSTPRLDVAIESELEYQAVTEADDPSAETSDLFLKVEPSIAFKLDEGFSIESGLVFERVRDLGPGEDRAFGDEGLFVQTLHAQYVLGRVAAIGGEINPGFGVAWDRAEGFFGAEVAEDFYEQTERLGFGLALELPIDNDGQHALSGSAFHADTSLLSRSIFTQRGRTTRGDGGPSNTENLNSIAVALDGEAIALGRAVFGYHIGYIKNAAGVTETEDEAALALALFGGLDLTPSFRLEPLAEYVIFDGAEGLALDRSILTLELAAQ